MAGMPSFAEIANITAETERLEKIRNECADMAFGKEWAWIKAEKKKLETDRLKS
jgi:hypothetical protein